MKNKKKILHVALFIGCLALAIGGGIWAFSASNDQSNLVNRIRYAGINGKIDETFTSNEDITIGGSQIKEVAVLNEGTTNIFVRVMVFSEIIDPSLDDGRLPANIGEEILVTLGQGWVDGADGYYYYTAEILPEASSVPLFSDVTIADTVAETYDGAEFSMEIKSETILSANHQYRKVWWNLDQSVAPTIDPLLTIDNSLDAIINA